MHIQFLHQCPHAPIRTKMQFLRDLNGRKDVEHGHFNKSISYSSSCLRIRINLHSGRLYPKTIATQKVKQDSAHRSMMTTTKKSPSFVRHMCLVFNLMRFAF